MHSFSMILRLKPNPNKELLAGLVKVTFAKRLISGFQAIRMFSIAKLNQKLVKFVLFLMAYGEKAKYRQSLRGITAFKLSYFTGNRISETVSEKSQKTGYRIVISPLSTEMNSIDTLTKSNSSNVIERRSSMHNFQQSLIKKFADKITQESKSNVIIKKAKEKIEITARTAMEKRKLYAESNKTKKILIKNAGKSKETLTKRKEALIKPGGQSLFDGKERKTIKYRNMISTLQAVLMKMVRKVLCFHFRHIKASHKETSLKIQIKAKIQPPESRHLDPSTWKSKLFSLGIIRFSRFIKLHLCRQAFAHLL